jgi:pimeloyl-ACP methyl ester carboxylesterase
MHEAIPGAEILVVPEGSHTAPLERPHMVDHAIVEFLARRLAAATTAAA